MLKDSVQIRLLPELNFIIDDSVDYSIKSTKSSTKLRSKTSKERFKSNRATTKTSDEQRYPSRNRKRINRANDIALYCHTKPDGDALGSMLALYVALKTKAKTSLRIAIRPCRTNISASTRARK